jgi:hypothetical protein
MWLVVLPDSRPTWLEGGNNPRPMILHENLIVFPLKLRNDDCFVFEFANGRNKIFRGKLYRLCLALRF